MEEKNRKIYTATTFDGKKVKGEIGYQQTFWGYEDLVIIDQRGRCHNVDPDSLKEVKGK